MMNPPRAGCRTSRPMVAPRHADAAAAKRAAGAARQAAGAARQAAGKIPVEPKVPRSVCRTSRVGAINILLVEGDITFAPVDALVNAANMLSFMQMDGGVSGAIRNACRPAVVTEKPKTWWDDKGVEHSDIKLAVTQAGVQMAAGALGARGVRWVIHAVGPNWSDYPVGSRAFALVVPRIKRTVQRALQAAARIGAKSVAIPPISGGRCRRPSRPPTLMQLSLYHRVFGSIYYINLQVSSAIGRKGAMCMNKSSEQPGELFWTQFLTGLRVSGKGRALLLPSNLSTSSGRSLCMPSTRLSMSAEPQTTICSCGGYIWLMERATQTPGSPVAMYHQFLRPLSERRPRLRSWYYLPRTVPIQRSSSLSARSSIPAGWLCLQVTASASSPAAVTVAARACY